MGRDFSELTLSSAGHLDLSLSKEWIPFTMPRYGEKVKPSRGNLPGPAGFDAREGKKSPLTTGFFYHNIIFIRYEY
jgi:hypothetical protein